MQHTIHTMIHCSVLSGLITMSCPRGFNIWLDMSLFMHVRRSNRFSKFCLCSIAMVSTYIFFCHKGIKWFDFRGTYRFWRFPFIGTSCLGFSCWDIHLHNHSKWQTTLNHLAIISLFMDPKTLDFFEGGFSFRFTLDIFTLWAFVIEVCSIFLLLSIFIRDPVRGLVMVSKKIST